MKKLLKNRQFQTFIILSFTVCLLKLLVYFEQGASDSNIKSFSEALWYSVVTLTTVGYGDNYPVTFGGKVISLFFVLGSLGVLSFLITQITIRISKYIEMKKNGAFGLKAKDHFVIMGWNSFSKDVAIQISKSGRQIAIITDNKDDIDNINSLLPGDNVFVFFADYNNYEVFEKVNIADSVKVFVSFNDDASTLIHVINLRKHYANIKVVVSLMSQDLKETFKSIGVSYLVSKNEIASRLVASYIYEPEAASLTEDLMENSETEEDADIVQYKVTADNPFLNKDYFDVFVDLKKNYNSVLLAISKKSNDYKIIKNPKESCLVEQDDYLILMTDGITKKQLKEHFKTEDGRISS